MVKLPPLRAEGEARVLRLKSTIVIAFTVTLGEIENEPKEPAVTLHVPDATPKLTVPKFASVVRPPAVEGLSAMHSADDRAAPETVVAGEA